MLHALENIYISPLETCNLHCQLCYTHKTKNILTNTQILSFVKRYQNYLSTFSLKSILFCGGEVFTLKNFPRLVNRLISEKIFITIITNGTIDRLQDIKDPQNCQLLVSLDGPKAIHDLNRGSGNFDKTIKFINHALSLNFPTEIMYLVTPDSYPFIDNFNIQNLKNNYITVKSKSFFPSLTTPSLTPKQIINLKQNYPSIPAKNFGCFQLSLQSDGQIYGCCESPYPIAKISTPISKTIKNFIKTLEPCTNCKLSDKQFFSAQRTRDTSPKVARTAKISLADNTTCQGCCAPDFLCGYKSELNLTSCQHVAKSFHDQI